MNHVTICLCKNIKNTHMFTIHIFTISVLLYSAPIKGGRIMTENGIDLIPHYHLILVFVTIYTEIVNFL